MITAKVFTTGGSQAIRLPKQFRFNSKEVYVKCVEGGVLLLEANTTWQALLKSIGTVSDDFMNERKQPALQQRKQL